MKACVCVSVWGQSKACFTPYVQALSEAAAWLQLFFHTDNISASSFLFVNEWLIHLTLFFRLKPLSFDFLPLKTDYEQIAFKCDSTVSSTDSKWLSALLKKKVKIVLFFHCQKTKGEVSCESSAAPIHFVFKTI